MPWRVSTWPCRDGKESLLDEIGFFADGIRSATVTALRDSIVLKLPQADFIVLTDRHPRVVERQRSSTSHFRLLS